MRNLLLGTALGIVATVLTAALVVVFYPSIVVIGQDDPQQPEVVYVARDNFIPAAPSCVETKLG